MSRLTGETEVVHMHWRARALIGGSAGVLAAAAAVVPVPTAASAATAGTGLAWASAGKATVRPGVTVKMAGVDCVAGFFLTDGKRVFISLPTACSGVSEGQPTDGCSAAQDPVGTTARIAGARYQGRLVYSSDTVMQLRGTTNATRCANNALALIRLDPRDVKRANPSVLGTGGPTGLARTSPTTGAALTVSVAGVPAAATLLQNGTGGWAHTVSIMGPVGTPQLGSPAMTKSGRAVGLVTLVQQSMSPPEGLGDLAHEIAYLQTVRGFGTVHLAKGTAAFKAA